MKHLRAVLAAIALLVGLPVFAQVQPVGVYPLNGSGPATITPTTIGGDSATSDVVPTARSISAQSAYPQATVNTAGANLYLLGGEGINKFTIVSNTALATKTITLTANGTLVTLTASAGAPAANQFGPVGTDDTAPQLAVTAAALAAAVNAHATLGPLMTAASTAATVYLLKQPTLSSLVIATGTAGALVTATSGTDGIVTALGQFNVVDSAGVVRAIFLASGNLSLLGGSASLLLSSDNAITRAGAGLLNTRIGAGTATANIGGTYAKFVSGTGVGNGADTTQDPLWTLTAIPANTFTANGDALVLTLGFKFGATANNKSLGMSVGGSSALAGNFTGNAVSGIATMTITRVDATHVNLCVLAGVGSQILGGSSNNLVVSDLTANTLAVVVTGASPTTGAANDVKLFSGVAEFKK